MGAGNTDIIIARTWLDEKGRTVKSLQPTSTGADAGTTGTAYYTAAPNTAHPVCGEKPEYAGYLCKTIPQGDGSVAEHQSAFNFYGQVTATVETGTGSTATRTTTQTYRADGQELLTTVSDNIAGSQAVQASEKLYDAKGRHNGTSAVAGSGLPQAEMAARPRPVGPHHRLHQLPERDHDHRVQRPRRNQQGGLPKVHDRLLVRAQGGDAPPSTAACPPRWPSPTTGRQGPPEPTPPPTTRPGTSPPKPCPAASPRPRTTTRPGEPPPSPTTAQSPGLQHRGCRRPRSATPPAGRRRIPPRRCPAHRHHNRSAAAAYEREYTWPGPRA